jgi:hypothetical protein
MNNSTFESVTFLNNTIKNKLLNQTIPMLEMLADKLGSRGCDDLNDENTTYSDAEKVLLNMEYCKINGSIGDDIKDGMFATAINRESNLVVVATHVLKQYLIDHAGYDDEE